MQLTPGAPGQRGNDMHANRTTAGYFRAYRGTDVDRSRERGYTRVALNGRPCWGRLEMSEYVSLLGWGDTSALLSDFSESDRESLIAHRDGL